MRPIGLLVLSTTILFSGCGADEPAATQPAAVWTPHFDEADVKPDSTRFVAVENGLEVKQGPNATIWNPDHAASGNYRVSVDVTHLDSGLHPHGAGLAIGGTDVHGEKQAYTYFLVRGDQLFLIKNRDGDTTDEVLPWTEHAAIAKEDEEFVMQNRLAVEVGAAETRFLINDTEVHRAPNASIRTEGLCGYRLVHDLHVRFENLRVEDLSQ